MKHKELFWTLEVLLLTPIAIFWLGVMAKIMTDSGFILNAIVGEPYQVLRIYIVTLILPALAVWYAVEFIKKNKNNKSLSSIYARTIVVVGIVSILLSLFASFPRT